MKKNKIIIIVVLIILIIGVILCIPNDSIVNKGNDTYTLMIYMCASDLESEDGFATRDIKEMLDATVDKKINLIIETGGTKQWKDYGISNQANQIYKIENGKMNLIEDNLGSKEMTNSNTLSEFITYCKDKYPADRYSLILWNHGGGAVGGFGYDENSSNEENTLTIDELNQAIQTVGVKFDFIGFDASLMANLETAFSLKDRADYLIASEEIEPGVGWEYKSLLNKLSSNTSENTLEISKVIVDNFIESKGTFSAEDATLSVIDLSKIQGVYKKLCDFVSEIKVQNFDEKNFSQISKAVNKTKSFANGESDMIDLIDFAKQVNNSKSNELVQEIQNSIIYYKNSELVENSNGISIYLPYKDLKYYNQMLKIYENIGIGKEYTDVITEFVNIMAGGKVDSYTINSHAYSIDNNYEQYEWYNQNLINENAEYYNKNKYNKLQVLDRGEYYSLKIEDSDWENIVNITCEVMYDDGEGYINLGSGNFFETDENGDLKVTFSRRWISIEGQTVPFYESKTTEKYKKGRVPAYLNDEKVNLIIIWDEKNIDGKVIGAEQINEYESTTISSKGLRKIKKGDKLEFIFDYYTYDGYHEDSYIIGNEIIIENENLKVNYKDIGDNKYYVYYKITDIYNNEHYTEPVIVY